MDSRVEALLFELGAIKGACEGVNRDVGRLSEEMVRNADSWRDVAVEQGATRHAIDGIRRQMAELDDSVKEQTAALAARVQVVEREVQPIVEWQRTGSRMIVALSSAFILLWALFGPGIQKLGTTITDWLFHRVP